MAVTTKEDIFDGIKGLSIMDVAWLVKQVEEEFGVSAAAPVAVAAAAPRSRPPPPPPPEAMPVPLPKSRQTSM